MGDGCEKDDPDLSQLDVMVTRSPLVLERVAGQGH